MNKAEIFRTALINKLSKGIPKNERYAPVVESDPQRIRLALDDMALEVRELTEFFPNLSYQVIRHEKGYTFLYVECGGHKINIIPLQLSSDESEYNRRFQVTGAASGFEVTKEVVIKGIITTLVDKLDNIVIQ
jgi:hypothetical protein